MADAATTGAFVNAPSSRLATYGAPGHATVNDGSNEYTIGCPQGITITPSIDEKEVFCAALGSRQKNASYAGITGYTVEITSPQIDNQFLKMLLGADTPTIQSEGTGSATDERATVDEYEWTMLAYGPLDTLTGVVGMPDGVITFSSPAWTHDYTAEAQSEAGTPFILAGSSAEDEYYAGWTNKCNRLHIDLDTVASGAYTPTIEYWNGSSWTAVSNVSDGTSGLTQDGVITWDMPVDWALHSIGTKPILITNMYIIKIDWNAGTGDPDCYNMREVYTENTDYAVDPNSSKVRVRRLVGTTVPDGSDVFVSYSYQTAQAYMFDAGTNLSQEYELEVVHDHEHGPGWDATFWRTRPKPGVITDSVDGEPIILSLTFEVLSDHDDHPDNPWFRLYHRGTTTPA
jgi:hypothetical protein